jgi:shikimate 5-dehydrogenase
MDVRARLQPHVTNPLPVVSQALVTGIVGDAPSKYARTPPLWNALYRDLDWDAVSLPWDVAPEALGAFVDAVRGTPPVAGFNVTNPYKIAIMPFLDDLDPLARQIGAVNTVARESGTRLVGYNTDGQGAIDALTMRLPGQERPFGDALAGRSVLMIGAGGAARAVAFYVAKALGENGRLRIVNRDAAKAADLATALHAACGVGEGAGEDRLADWLADADLVINSSLKGQTGWRRLADGSACQLEPYSALAPADPARVPAGLPLDAAASRRWLLASRADLQENWTRGLDAIARLRPDAACFDLIYAPLETTFLRDARLAGHATQNGKWMNIAQAADAFARKVCRETLVARGLTEQSGYDRALQVMTRVW